MSDRTGPTSTLHSVGLLVVSSLVAGYWSRVSRCPRSVARAWSVRPAPTGRLHPDYGILDLREGTAKSVNTFFVKPEQKVGLCKTWQMTKSSGSTAAATDGRCGSSPHSPSAQTHPFEKVTDSGGKQIQGLEPDCNQALSKGAANAVAEAMQSVLEPGGTGYGHALEPDQVPARRRRPRARAPRPGTRRRRTDLTADDGPGAGGRRAGRVRGATAGA